MKGKAKPTKEFMEIINRYRLTKANQANHKLDLFRKARILLEGDKAAAYTEEDDFEYDDITINGIKYVLDSCIIRDIKKQHFCCLLTCEGKEYAF